MNRWYHNLIWIIPVWTILIAGIVFGSSCQVKCEQERTKRHGAEVAAFGRTLPANWKINRGEFGTTNENE